jgi:uncharacterized membrane protein YeaQ/YmgE (transglycosylase-associated protein family)
MTMCILRTILIGLVAGAVAKLLMPGKDPGGFVITILLGIAGSLIATYNKPQHLTFPFTSMVISQTEWA